MRFLCPFRYIKQVFGYSKVLYLGLAKHISRLHLLAVFTNLFTREKNLLAQVQCVRIPLKWWEAVKK
jgi:IS5 family transposase